MWHNVIYICTQHILCSRKLTEIAGHSHLYPTAPLIMAVLVQLKRTYYTNKHHIHFLNHILSYNTLLNAALG